MAEGLELEEQRWLSACLGLTSLLPFLLQFAIGSLMDDYLGEYLIYGYQGYPWRGGE